ncbi:MAG: sucrase ferredoxin [Solirubrobacteraceae bacterium MAG38_C4-C5]|nr:sucrase ferredoxin [Candidatus Siliceabacter maunaloa]
MISRRPDACTRLSAGNGEPLHGMAPAAAQAYLAVEETQPWGPYGAGRSECLPAALREVCDELGVRLLLIRRAGRYEPRRRTVLAAYADYYDGWVHTSSVADPRELLELDLGALAAGRPPPGTRPHDASAVLACTHGTVDPCCAEIGRPVARALHDALGDALWQCSHLGGCRFAASALVLPRGIMLGRLVPATAPRVVGAAIAGHLELDHYRGRPGAPQAVQVAEAHLRRRLGLYELDDIAVLDHRSARRGEPETIHLRAGTRAYALRLALEALPTRPHGCGDDEPLSLEVHRVVDCQRAHAVESTA